VLAEQAMQVHDGRAEGWLLDEREAVAAQEGFEGPGGEVGPLAGVDQGGTRGTGRPCSLGVMRQEGLLLPHEVLALISRHRVGIGAEVTDVWIARDSNDLLNTRLSTENKKPTPDFL
jgi:hypothetical protein